MYLCTYFYLLTPSLHEIVNIYISFNLIPCKHYYFSVTQLNNEFENIRRGDPKNTQWLLTKGNFSGGRLIVYPKAYINEELILR